MEFIKDLEDKAYLLDFDNKPYRQEDAVKDAAIFGMSDSRLKEKALTDDPQLKDLIRWGQARESGKEGIHNLKDETKYVQRINDIENLSDCDEIDDLIESLQVMKLRKAGKFSGKSPKSTVHRTTHQTTAQQMAKSVSHVGDATIFQIPKLANSPKTLNTWKLNARAQAAIKKTTMHSQLW